MRKPQVEKITRIAREAGSLIMSYRGRVSPSKKADNSVVTEADIKASALIVKALKSLTIVLPVVSEEADMEANRSIVRNKNTYWMVDPLDGTQTYLKGHDGFGVHIALIHKGEPILGVAYFPAQDKLYYTGNDGKAYMQQDDKKAEEIHVKLKKSLQPKVLTAVGWGEKNDIKKIGMYQVDPVRAVGGARLCVAAEGKAEIAAMNGNFSYWDVAAGHAILKAAGGDLIDTNTGKPLTYKNESLVVPPSFGGSKGVLSACFPNMPNAKPEYQNRAHRPKPPKPF